MTGTKSHKKSLARTVLGFIISIPLAIIFFVIWLHFLDVAPVPTLIITFIFLIGIERWKPRKT